MKIKVVTHASNPNHEGFLKFKQSVDKFGYDYTVYTDTDFNWAGICSSYIKFCKEPSDYTHILSTDCYDVVVLAPMSEIYEKYKEHDKGVFAAEKPCYPLAELSAHYPPVPHDWKHVNGGGYLFPIPLFLRMIEETPISGQNQQLWLTRNYLYYNKGYLLDTNCDIFQTLIAESPDDFAITRDERLLNRKTGSLPVILHNNGGTNHVPEWVTRKLL